MTTDAGADAADDELKQPPAEGAGQQPPEKSEEEKIWAELMAADEPEAATQPVNGEDVSHDFGDQLQDDPAAVSTIGGEGDKNQSPEGADIQQDGAAKGTSPQPDSSTKDNDIWANATPELRAAHEAEVAALRQQANDAKRNIGRVRKQYEELKASADRAADPQNSSKKVGDMLDESLAEYPEIRDPVKTALAPIEKKLEKLDQFEASDRTAKQDEVNEHIKREQMVLARKYPNWDKDFVAGDRAKQFYDWVLDQPRATRETVFVTNKDQIFDGEAAIEVFDAFTAHLNALANPPGNGPTQELSPKRAAQLEGTRSPRSPGGAPRVSGIPKEGDPQSIWNAFPDDNADDRLIKRRV
jgi:hypothetical protein